jgi:predicted metal-dependent phosphotriesterase family hydrolase
MTGLLDDFVPALRAAGVDTESMAHLLIHNPARVLEVA